MVLGSDGEGKYIKKAGLITHDRSQSHRRVEAAHKTQRGPMDTVIEKMTNEKTVVLNNLFNTAYHVARYKLPFRHYQPLCELQEKNGVCMGGYFDNARHARYALTTFVIPRETWSERTWEGHSGFL